MSECAAGFKLPRNPGGKCAECGAGPDEGCRRYPAKLERENAALKSQLEAARAALRKYGQHTTKCRARGWSNGAMGCDCGLDAALQKGAE